MASTTDIALAELLGMHAGDGTLYRTNSGGIVWELRGNLDEQEFYDNHVVPLILHLGFSLQGKRRSGGKNGCYGVRCCKRGFIGLLTGAGFCIGRKTATVRIPDCILHGDTGIKAAFLRGLFATDGTVHYAAINSGTIHSYPMIELCSASKQLRDDVRELLSEFALEGNA